MKIVSYIIISLIIGIGIIIFIIFNKTVSLENSLNNFPTKFTFYQYSNGEIIEKKIISKNDKEYIELLKILNLNVNNWQYKIRTYAPQKYFVSPNIIINLKENIIVINDKNMIFQIVHKRGQ